jgi:putative addiction module component (TIGR02574 family)
MSETAQQLLVAVQALPYEEQRELADTVLDRLDEPGEELEQELNRRWQGYLQGNRPGVSAEVVAQKVRAEFGTT